MKCIVLAVVLSMMLYGCKNSTSQPPVLLTTTEETIKYNIEQLKQVAQVGDLVVRLNDDVISDRIRFINEKDKSYSHTGMVLLHNGKKYVAHIAPEEMGADSIQFVPLDSFINPVKHIKCALYRYNLNNAEKQKLVSIIHQYKNDNIRFDNVYDLDTYDKMYCSEMISKALQKATNNRIICRQTIVPPALQKKMVAQFFEKEKITGKIVAERKIITIDNLYLHPASSLIMEITLKHFPEEVDR